MGNSALTQFEQEVENYYGDKLEQGNVWQIPVPEEMINKSFEKLFGFLLEKKLVALGIYRLPGASDNKYPYVVCNPDPKMNISVRDKVFVIGKKIANDLIEENSQAGI